MNWVMDVSAGMEVAREATMAATILKCLEETSVTFAPTLYFAEVQNTCWKYHMFADHSIDSCMTLGQLCFDLIDEFIPLELLSENAFKLAVEHQCSVYDAYYLGIALGQGCGLLTLDKKLARIAKKVQVPLL